MLTEVEKRELKQKIQSNHHEIYAVSIEEMDAIIRSSVHRNKKSVQTAWTKIKSNANLGASYTASVDDVRTMTKLIGDLGSYGARVYIKSYGGNTHIILKGRPGLRKILTGTKYGIQNPKVVTMGLGKAGAVKAVKSGGILTVVLMTAYRVIDFVLTDEATLSQLVGTLATDIVKIGITTGASIAAAAFVAGVTTLAIGPILAVIVVGVGVSMLLDNLDKKYGITDRIIVGLDEISDSAQRYVDKQKQTLKDAATDAADSVIDYALETAERIAINWVKNQLGKYFSIMPIFK